MPETRNATARRGRSLTTAGLIAVTAATLLMMAWAIFPSAAFADGQNTVTWTVNGASNLPCVGGVTQWQLAGFGNIQETDFTVVSLTVNGVNQGDPDSSTGGTFKWQVPGPGTTAANTTASATYSWTGDTPGVPNLTISHCTGGTTTTTTTTVPTETETTTTTVPTETETTTTTVPTETETTTTTVPTETETTTTTVPTETETTTTTVPTETTTTTVPTETETTTTTVPTETETTTTTVPTETTTTPVTTPPVTTTTTTEGPTVGPTTVEPTDHTSVAPTTITPGGTAFTGVENVVPIGAIALMLMTSGSGLLWAGSRRRRDQDDDEE